MTQYLRGVEFCSKAKQTSNDAAVPFLCPMKALLILICFGNERGNEPSSGMDGAASSADAAIPSRSLPVRIRLRPCSGSLAVVQRASEFCHIALCCCLGS